MKKILFTLILLISFTTGCMNNKNTPSKAVESFFDKYQKMDSEVLLQLDSVISNDNDMNDTQKKDFKALMEKQYQNLSYKIIDEDIDGDYASVEAEIEVFDYASSIRNSLKYFEENPDKFKEEGNDNNTNLKYIDYKIKQMKDVIDRVQYKINFNLSKKDNKWIVEDINDMDRNKIHGLLD